MHLTFLVRTYFSDETWQDSLKQERIAHAKNLLEKRKKRNEAIDLTDCLQFADKRDLVCASEEMQKHLGLKSKKEAGSVLKSIEKLRDKLVHSQDIVSGTTWKKLIEDMQQVERMLQQSDDLVEKGAHSNTNDPLS